MARELTPEAVLAEVDRIMSEPWSWGLSDCSASACDVFAALHGVDPLAPVRGSYGSPIGAIRLIQRWGGFAEMANALAVSAGLQIGQGAPGEIGLSMPGAASWPDGAARGLENRCLLICVQPGHWAGKTMTGYAIISNAERCWRV